MVAEFWLQLKINSLFGIRLFRTGDFLRIFSQQFKSALDELARGGIFIGTSSWKYSGWCGQIYDEQRYPTRGKLSVAKFERGCLCEYAQEFLLLGVEVSDADFSETIAHLQKAVSHIPLLQSIVS